ncbi:uncharacterized protein METZ01_LOCUS110002 [marine metagenome]|uniref:Uncharacterized protein n=1 Tax=marine metagenome TaxID=408172 RepID=A0A381WXZ1_9ZZZZ
MRSDRNGQHQPIKSKSDKHCDRTSHWREAFDDQFSPVSGEPARGSAGEGTRPSHKYGSTYRGACSHGHDR